MGVFTATSIWARRPFGGCRLAGILAGILLFTSISAAPSFAGTDTLHPDHPDRSVSTSPAELTKRGSADAQPADDLRADDPPLTRAATQLRIDEMSPTRWLSRYGSVSIDHRD